MRRLDAIMRMAAALAALVFFAGLAHAQQGERPLTLENKSVLFQRVIAVPGARLSDEPGADEPGEVVTPFTVYYVYERRTAAGREWLRVGSDSNGRIEGWLPAEQGVEWRQALTVSFKDPEEAPRVLLFENRDPLVELVESGDAERYERLRQRAIGGDVADSPVVAVQPDEFIDIRRNFYLVPILEHEDVLVGGNQSRLLRVASVPLRDPAPADNPYRAGIVFVIDTTVSMQPYIDRTRAIVQRVYDELTEAGLADKVGYGLVAYRDNTEAVPELDYTTRVISDLTSDGEAFLEAARGVQAATVSSEEFNEDAYAGIQQAVDSISWGDYFARYVVLITDAGPRTAGDPLATTSLSTSAARERLLDERIAPWVLHLKTPRGEDNHASAEQEYRSLANIPDIGSFYHAIETGDVDQFENALTTLTDQLTQQVRGAAQGFQPLRVASGEAEDPELAAMQERVSRLGYALRMDYLQQRAGEGVPALFNAWMVDRDFSSPDERAVDVRVLLSRDQLSDLHGVLSRVVERAEEGALAPQTFLDELRSLAAIVSRDPEAVSGSGDDATLADLGYMREYIEGLPYQSDVMDVDLSDWQQWSAQRQFEFINELDNKVSYYRALHDNLDLWLSLDGGPVDGDSVYPLLLEALP